MTPLDAALAIAARGLRVVWIRPREKRPLVERWTELATSDPDELREQARDVPANAGVGIALGPQADGRYVLAIDVDDQDRWLELQTEHGPLPPTLAISSARGDKCLYEVQADPETIGRLRNVTGLGKRPGVDVKLAGGQVVAPPSIHPSGTAYTWHTDLPIAVLPDAWLRAILPLLRVAPPPPPSSPPAGDIVKRAAAYLEKMEPSLAGQGGHDRAFAAARKLVKDFQLSPSVALNLLSRWNQRCVPPWSLRELQHKIDDAVKARISNPIQDRPRQEVHVPIQPRVEEPRIEFLSHDELYTPDPPADLLVPGLGICAGPVTAFFGQSYVGKSICTMAFGMSVSLGIDLWGKWSVRRGVWVHLDYEQGRRRTKKIVQRLTVGLGLTLEDTRGHLRAAVYPPINLTTKDAVDHYARAFDGAALATVDALKGVTPGVDENSSEMRDYMGILRLASEKTGCVVLLNHNAGKPPVVGQRARKHEGRGSSGIFDECQSVFVSTGTKGEPSLVTHEKDRELGRCVDDFQLRIFDVEVNRDLLAGLGVLVVDAETPVTVSKTSQRQSERAAREAERETLATARREANARAALDARRRRDEGDDDAARTLRAERPTSSERELRSHLEKRLACGRDRASAALERTKVSKTA